jgi:Arc/MetJ-type ribon-helix-helix transcriptional regulator
MGKISVSLPDEDIRFLDERGSGNRSAALHEAVDLLRRNQLSDQYAEAFTEWNESGEAAAWEQASADGLPA